MLTPTPNLHPATLHSDDTVTLDNIARLRPGPDDHLCATHLPIDGFGTWLAAVRADRTYAAIAYRLGKDRAYVTRVEQGVIKPSFPRIAGFARQLGAYAFFMLFSETPVSTDEQPEQVPALLLGPVDYARRLGAYFRAERQQRFPEEHLDEFAKSRGLDNGNLSAFELGSKGNPTMELVEARFALLGIGVGLCAVEACTNLIDTI